MQLSAGTQVLIRRDYMTASKKPKEAETIFCRAPKDVQKLPYHYDIRDLAVSQLKRLDPLKVAAH